MSNEHSKLTPMLRQYYDIKSSIGDAILFFRMGDFFEIFGEDAELIAPKLDVVLTAREKGDQTKIPFCGVPHHSAKGYWLKLVKLGYKVAICEQLESASEAKGLVKRGITRIYSPGNLDELEGLEKDAPNYLLAWMEVPEEKHEILVVLDVSTGEIRTGKIPSGELLKYVRQFRPSEILVRRFAASVVSTNLEPWMRENTLRMDFLPEAPLKDTTEQKSILGELFGLNDPKILESPHVQETRGLITAVFSHLKAMKTSLNQFLRVDPLEDRDTMALSETVIRDLELFETSRRRNADGSLVRVIDRTFTPMGARCLRHSICYPLTRADLIKTRHEAVGQLVHGGEEEIFRLRSTLKGTPDLARLATRILSGTISPAELGLVRTALIKANETAPILNGLSGDQSSLKALAHRLVEATDALTLLARVLKDEPESLGSGRGVFKSGFDSYLDDKNDLTHSAETRVTQYEEKLKREIGIQSLKVKHHKSFGLLLEVSKSNVSKVPASFIRRQTMTNGERYTTIELKQLDDEISSANDLAVQREAILYQELLESMGPYREKLMSVARAIGELDMLQGFAWLALKEQYTKPILCEKPRRLTLQGCRHPVVEKFVGKHSFVPNDIYLNETKNQILITGPNMAGKSTVMRQTAVAAILCQAGSWVPATHCEMPIFDGIYTRVGASDDLSRGQSTFMVEMSEAADILRNATHKSLVILDEVGRGTSTTDGLAIAASILEDLNDRVRCFTLFATHYHELVPMMSSRTAIVPMQTQVVEKSDGIIFSHRLVAGASASSFGIEVAKLAGVPTSVIEMAKNHLLRIETPTIAEPPKIEPLKKEEARSSAKAVSKVQQGLFGLEEELSSEFSDFGHPQTEQFLKLASRLERIRIHKTTPLQALNILNELKAMLIPVKQRTLFDEDLTQFPGPL